MIDLYYWPTPNGKKVTIFLEEAGLPYNLIPLDIGRGDQFSPAFLKINPNHRMPATVQLVFSNRAPSCFIWQRRLGGTGRTSLILNTTSYNGSFGRWPIKARNPESADISDGWGTNRGIRPMRSVGSRTR